MRVEELFDWQDEDLNEASLPELGFRQDNPALHGVEGREWLADAQAAAEESNPRYRMLNGKVTASLGNRAPLLYPAKLLLNIPGSYDEHLVRAPGEGQYDRLDKLVTSNGFDNSAAPVLVGINHKGGAYVLEGNTRIRVAVAHNVDYIYAEFKWFNGAELLDGPYSPEEIAKDAKRG